MANKKILNVVQWFKRISHILNWASDCISRFPNFKEIDATSDDSEYYRKVNTKLTLVGLLNNQF